MSLDEFNCLLTVIYIMKNNLFVILWDKVKFHNLTSYHSEALFLPWQSCSQIRLWNYLQKDVQRKVDGFAKRYAGRFFVADIGERFFFSNF